MKLNLTWATVAKATRGDLQRGDGAAAFHAISTDSRKAGQDDAFLALRGERFDAHDFLNEDLAERTGGWIVAQGTPLPTTLPAQVLAVPDTLRALADLAMHHRRRFDIPVVGITGTNGKTTVKDMILSILSLRGEACANSGNFNNEVGLPLSVLKLTEQHAYGIFEMGASRKGDIRYLCNAAQPTLGVLTNIGPAHLEFFGDIETVFETKLELVHSLPHDAPVALNIDDPLLRSLLPLLGKRVISYGSSETARVRILPNTPKGTVHLNAEGHTIVAGNGTFGAIHRINAAAAAAAATALGISPEEIQKGLNTFEPSPLRFACHRHPIGASLIIDAYNANPASMRAGIETFIELNESGKRFLVLGDMLELGKESTSLHAEIGAWIAGLDVDGVFLIGPLMKATAEALRMSGRIPVSHATTPEEIAEPLKRALTGDSAVYFKASRAMRLEDFIEAL